MQRAPAAAPAATSPRSLSCLLRQQRTVTVTRHLPASRQRAARHTTTVGLQHHSSSRLQSCSGCWQLSSGWWQLSRRSWQL
jgi:hypothetical protein